MKPTPFIALAAALAFAPAAQAAPSLQARIDQSKPGDTIRLTRGTYAGPIHIDHSLALIGNGSVIRGGGPVVRIDAPAAVSIDGVTITGGVTTASDYCGPLCGPDYVKGTALGGGVEIGPPPDDIAPATVTITDSVITGNRAANGQTVSSIRAVCPGGPCRFGLGSGGGIDNWGNLTLVRTRVTGNQAGGPLSSDADGGGISSGAGSLTLDHSVVSDNRAVAVPPHGRFAEGGGLFVTGGTLTVRDSRIDDNVADLTSTLPAKVGDANIDMNAHAGAIHTDPSVSATIDRSSISRNEISAVDPVGAPLAFNSAMLLQGPAAISDTVIDANRLTGVATSTEDTGDAGGAVELDGGGTLTRTALTRNVSVQRTTQGLAAIYGALAVFTFEGDPKPVVMTDSVVAGNQATAITRTGDAVARGGGVFNNSLLTLRRTLVHDNSVQAAGRTEGGGVWNGVALSGPPVELTLDHVAITANRLIGGTRRGGGLFTSTPFTQTGTLFSRNAPDQVVSVSS
ncbi:hypothetical protein [Solirubrobacter soli]|uniref:hypothetical protein n=1 Tax=Solirubrobacter soli TaxID=363832 RepID=UPI0003F7016D|nr:hypothetical protein [Solirubrobacter soli]